MESFMNLANLYSRFPAKYGEAEKYYLKALQMAPEAALLRYNYGVFLANTKRPGAAEKELLRALECDSSYHPAYNQLGIIALQTGRPQVAEKCFSAALELVPDHPGYRNNLQFVRNGNRSSANN
jgi:Tfp pilus assembly protein PilF